MCGNSASVRNIEMPQNRWESQHWYIHKDVIRDASCQLDQGSLKQNL